MSIQFSQGKLQGQERRTILQEVRQQMQQAALEGVRVVVTDVLEAEVTAKLGREKGKPRVATSQEREIDWKCGTCGCRDANYFTRDGHYRRELQTGWGTVQNMQVPMLECQRCKHDVICDYTILEKHQRFWLDLDQDVLWSSGCGQSLREICERWSATVGSTVGLRTINERINQIEPLVQQAHNQPIKQAPQVIQLDGIWVTITSQGETVTYDKRNRARGQRKGKKVVILVALGFWTENGEEKREIVDWQIADSEKHEEWEMFLRRLSERGIKPENGLKAIIRDGCGGLGQAVDLVYAESVIDQRCIFHKLKNVSDKCRTELKGDEQKEERRQLMREAGAVYQAESAEQAKERLAAWSTKWGEIAPESVATFERDFDATIAYYQLEGVALQWVRSTSLLERVNRQLRRTFRQALSFGSTIGAEVALYLQVQRLHAQWTQPRPGGTLPTLSTLTWSVSTLREEYNIEFTSKHFARFLGRGDWLEVYVWCAAKEAGFADDQQWGYTMRSTANNEIDVVLTYRAQLIFAECKTDENPFQTGYLDGINSKAEMLGGNYVTKIFVTNASKTHPSYPTAYLQKSGKHAHSSSTHLAMLQQHSSCLLNFTGALVTSRRSYVYAQNTVPLLPLKLPKSSTSKPSAKQPVDNGDTI